MHTGKSKLDDPDSAAAVGVDGHKKRHGLFGQRDDNSDQVRTVDRRASQEERKQNNDARWVHLKYARVSDIEVSLSYRGPLVNFENTNILVRVL